VAAILDSIEVYFEATLQDIPQHYWGYLLYMELEKRLSYNMVGLLSADHSFSFAQYAEPLPSGQLLWHICCWDEELSYSIYQVIHAMPEIVIYDRNHPVQLRTVRLLHHQWTEEELAKDYFLTDSPIRVMGVRVITPALHKSEGRYSLFPSVELIYYSIIKRCQIFTDRFGLRDKALVAELVNHTRLWQYELKTVPYEINGSNIVGFRGTFQVHFDAEDSLARLSGLIFSLAEFTGIGIRTVEGMGACKIAT